MCFVFHEILNHFIILIEILISFVKRFDLVTRNDLRPLLAVVVLLFYYTWKNMIVIIVIIISSIITIKKKKLKI